MTGARSTATLPVRFSVLGRALYARVATASLAAHLEHHWHYEEHTGAAHPYRIDVIEGDGNVGELPGPDWRPTEVRLPDGIALRGWSRDLERCFLDDTVSVRAHFGAEGAQIRVARAAARDASSTLYRALYLCINEALRVSGLLPLHAAVVVRDREATALCAPSGTGKTTTLLHLLARGWHPLSEDLAWLDPATRTLHGWDRGVRIWDEGVRRLPAAWQAVAWRADVDGKLYLPWSAVEAARVPVAHLARLVLLERGGAQRSRIEPLPPRDAVRLLWEAAGVPLTPAARGAAAVAIDELIRDLEFARIRLGSSSPVPDPDSLGQSGQAISG